jgi:uncharacterized protein (TIGR00251 family)
MRDRDVKFSDPGGGAAFTVKVVPRANRSEIVGIREDGTIKIRLMAPPIEGEQNQELIHFLAEFLGVRVSDVEILGVLRNRTMLITVMNIPSEVVEEKVRAAAGEGYVSDDED